MEDLKTRVLKVCYSNIRNSDPYCIVRLSLKQLAAMLEQVLKTVRLLYPQTKRALQLCFTRFKPETACSNVGTGA